MATSVSHDAMANAIRFLCPRLGRESQERPPRSANGIGRRRDGAVARHAQIRRLRRHWPDRDRFVLSAGHGCMLLYALLYLTGVGGPKGARPSKTSSSSGRWVREPRAIPEYWCAPGVETTTGPLGQGISTAVGMAIAERMMAARFPGVVDHHTYVIASDGDLMEGVSQEAIGIAGHLKLNKLIVFWDNNGISIDGHDPGPRRQHRPGRTFPVGGLEFGPYRRPRPQGDSRRHPRGAEIRPADDDRLQDDDRLWPANACGNQQGA